MAMQCSGFRYLQVMVYCEAAQEQRAATQELDLCFFFCVWWKNCMTFYS